MKFFIAFLFLAMICPISYAATPDDLVLYMSFDSGTVGGGQVKDLTKYGNNGVIKGNPKTVNGKKGNALEFNGSSDSVEIQASESLSKTASQITMEAWVFSTKDAQVDVISKWDNVMNGIIHFEFQAGGVIRYCMRDKNDATIINLLTPAGKLPLKEWVHITESYDGKVAKIYVNATEVLSGNCSGNMRDNKDIKFWIGSMYATDRWFGGMIDEVRIWSRALSVDEIKKSMEGIIVGLAVGKESKLTATWGQLKAN